MAMPGACPNCHALNYLRRIIQLALIVRVLYVTGGFGQFSTGRFDVKRKILVMGLPSAGKTTLSKVLAPRLNAVHFNADEVRANVNKDLGFSEDDRIEQARRMGWLCDQVVHVGGYAIADFICPTPVAREA